MCQLIWNYTAHVIKPCMYKVKVYKRTEMFWRASDDKYLKEFVDMVVIHEICVFYDAVKMFI
jgi:predicted Zn-dependent protease with MMP-like domain